MVTTRAYLGGTFDLLHPGHIALLRWAKANFREVVVGLNTDEFVERVKGRPIMTYEERKDMLLAVRYVDYVVLNLGSEKSLSSILASKATHIVAGADWRPREKYLKQLGLTEEDLKIYGLDIVFYPNSLPIRTTEIKQRVLSSKSTFRPV